MDVDEEGDGDVFVVWRFTLLVLKDLKTTRFNWLILF